MQKFLAYTNRKPTNLVVNLSAPRKTKIRITALDPKKLGAMYMDREATVEGNKSFEIRLPQSPEKLLIKIIAKQGSVKVNSIKEAKLPRYLNCISGKKVSTFLKFAMEFSENAGILATGRYVSDNKKYVIDYLPEVVHESGKVLSTPARISNSTGRMEISKKAFSKMTIPMRMAILCHEFSHFYLNEVQSDEIEADLNSLAVYLAVGYPVIEAHKAFLDTFEGTPTETNKERYTYLKTFIDNFDDLKHKICKMTP
tara:strand:- start:25 stop:789 length:765 start_codon:yes stop_codon:yes gene_type:complete